MSKDAIIVKSAGDIEHMRRAGKITAAARTIARQAVAAGITTKQIDREVHEFIVKNGARPTFLGYGGFPASACVSVNDEIIHGIPGKRKILEGDIVSIDVGATYEGFVGDCAGTFPCGEISEQAQKLIKVTRQSFFEGIKFARSGYRISDIGAAVQVAGDPDLAGPAEAAFVSGMDAILLIAALVAVAGAALALVLVRDADFVTEPEPAPAAA